MSKMQRTKGAGYEREVAKEFRAAGMEASRNLTQVRDGGWDLNTSIGPIECKRRRKLPAYLLPAADVVAVVCREDEGQSLAVVRLSYLLALVELARSRRGRRVCCRSAEPGGEGDIQYCKKGGEGER